MEAEWIEEERRQRLDTALNRDFGTPENRETVLKLDKKWALNSLSLLTRYNKVRRAIDLSKFLGKPYRNASREDLEAYLAQKTDNKAPATVTWYKAFLKKFYTELLNPDQDNTPPIVSWISYSRQRQKTKLPTDLLTPREIRTLAEATTHPRNRALLLILYDSAARASELLSLRVGDIQFDEYGARITLRGKTGERKVRLINSVPALRQWLNHHPNRDDREAPLFIAVGGRNRGEALQYDGLYSVVKSAERDANLDKDIHPHLLRHSRLTELAKTLSESELKVFAGWTASSEMARVYIHLSGEDVDEKLLQHAGMTKPEKEETDDPLRPTPCPRCSEENSATDRYCSKCSMPLSYDQRLKAEKQRDNLMKRLPSLLNLLDDPEVKQLLERKASQAT